MRGLRENISKKKRARSFTTKKNINEIKRTQSVYLFCKLNRAVYREDTGGRIRYSPFPWLPKLHQRNGPILM